MKTTLLTPASVEPLALPDAKAYLRVDYASDDDLIQSLIASARAQLEAEIALCLISRRYLVEIEDWPICAPIKPPVQPVLAIESVMIDGDKLLDHIHSDALIVDCSTVAPQNSRRVAEEAAKRGLSFVDAPVSGGVAAAAAGTLAFMCGGPEADVERAGQVLNAMGNNVFRAGDHGAGSVAKICNNMLLAIHMAGTAEALQLGIDNGLDPNALSEIMLKSSGCNWSLEKYNPCPGVMEGVPSSNDYQGGFMVQLMQKDLGLAAQAANGSESYTPMGELAAELYARHSEGSQADGRSNADIDFASIMQLFANKG